MLAERVTEWTEEWKRQGLEQGRLEGRQEGQLEGRQEGEAAILIRLLTLRFGPLDESSLLRIRQADAETLLQWGERVLTAVVLEDVFRL